MFERTKCNIWKTFTTTEFQNLEIIKYLIKI